MKVCLLAVLAGLLGLAAHASQLCNDSGNAPMSCESSDGQFAIEISGNADATGLGVSSTSFCANGYLKINGVEINGAKGTRPLDPAITVVDAVTSQLGVRVSNPATHKLLMPQTAIGFVLKAGISTIKSGHVFVFGDQTAWMYLYGDGGQQTNYARLVCK
jgi:hypothetical protein